MKDAKHRAGSNSASVNYAKSMNPMSTFGGVLTNRIYNYCNAVSSVSILGDAPRTSFSKTPATTFVAKDTVRSIF